MRPSFEKLIPATDSSIRCFDRREIERPAGWHYHPEMEICFVEHGSGTRFVGDHIDDYSSGDLVIVGANLPHHWASDQFRGQKFDRHPALVAQFDPDCFGEKFLQLPEMAETAGLLRRALRGLQVIGKSRQATGGMMRDMLAQRPPDRLVTLLNLLALLARADDLRPLASQRFAPSYRLKSQDRLSAVCKHIHDHLAESSLNQTELARVAGMNASSFSRFFKKGTQRTVTEYVNELRIGLASRMLLESDQNIFEICLSVGYENASNFNRRFREYRGLSPREFRARHRRHSAAVARGGAESAS